MTVLSFVNDFVLAAGSNSLADGIRTFLGPLISLAVGIIALTFLVKREMTQFIIFLVIAIVVLVLFYSPEILSGLAKNVSDQSGSGGTWKG